MTRPAAQTFLTTLVLWCVAAAPASAEAPKIRFSTIGFLPDAPKRASVAAACSDFSVVRAADGVTVFTGKATAPRRNADTGEDLATLDLSAVTEPGSYYLDVAGVGRTPAFEIGRDVYDASFYAATRAMYLWRCGTAVSGTHGGHTFAHAACHTRDAFLDHVGGGHVARPSVGGWHDAGDYNKYVVNAGFTVGVMLGAWEQLGQRIRAVSLDIPESKNNTPDLLDEVRWELEWMLSMQADDGRVYHKVSTLKFGGFVLPDRETADRFFAPWGTAATADLAAVMAMAARAFAPYDLAFSRRCRAAAERSYAHLAAHPEDVRPDQRAFSTGPYDAPDDSRRLWAAAEMWQTTGEAVYLKDFETRAKAQRSLVDNVCGWGNVKNLGVYTYLFSDRPGRDRALVDATRAALTRTAGEIVAARDAHGYARPLGTRYSWGGNGDVAQQVQTLHLANRLSPKPAYREAALDAIGHLFGRNVYGRSFVTGLGANPPMHPHDRRSGADDVPAPWPGYLVGGGHPKATDWVDDQESYRTNEIAINWNATLIYALAWAADDGREARPAAPAGVPAKTPTD